MHKCGQRNDPKPANTMHTFVDLNGLPYLLGEYLDRRGFQTVDRSAITSGIYIDTSDAMRAVIDISINDIGERSDRSPNIVGNNRKQKGLLDMISRHAGRLDGQLPVLRGGIIVRVNYRLEEQRTGRTIRSMVEDLRIGERSYFLDINQRDFNDNAVVVNFSNSIVSTINEFTHGRNQMVLRVTDIQMFYELVTDRQPIPRIKQSLVSHPYDYPDSYARTGTNEEYFYHDEMQNRHYLGDPNENQFLSAPRWAMFNQFYHFDQDGRKIILHMNEIYDPMRKTNLIPCGTVSVNRMFMINPGHRIIFKFSIWKNDVTAVYDTLKVAKALKAKFYNWCDHHNCDGDICDDPNRCDCNRHCHNHHEDHSHDLPECDRHGHHKHHPDEYNQLISMLYDERKQNEKNGAMISELIDKIKDLESRLEDVGDRVPDEGPLTGPPDYEGSGDPTPVEPGEELSCDCGCDHGTVDTMSPEKVEEIFGEVVNNKEGEI